VRRMYALINVRKAARPPFAFSSFLSLDEAEAVSNELATVVADAKNGKFSEFGGTLIARGRERAKGD
jgi:hypothetical protein